MKKLLYLDACIRDEESRTKRIAQPLVEALKERYAVETLCMNELELSIVQKDLLLRRMQGDIDPVVMAWAEGVRDADRIVIADGNFPAHSMGKDCIVIRMDGHGIPEVLDAILSVIPLDSFVEKPATLMQLMDCDVGKIATPIWDTYADVIAKHDARGKDALGNIDRFDFYEEAKKCYCIVATGEGAVYANIMLQKGVI